MNDNEEEEIKIEYFESFEEDPLCGNTENNICDKNVSTAGNNKSINQQVSDFVNEKSDNFESASNELENFYPVVTQNEESWYKSRDHLGKYICKFCEHSYSTIQTVRHHVKNKHIDDYHRIKTLTVRNIRQCKLKCHLCEKRFKNTKDLQIHIKYHGIDNLIKSCFVCHATFNEDTALLIHMTKEHKSVKKKPHFCTLCGYSTFKLSHYKQHEKTHSFTDKKKCSFCEYTTYHLSNLKIHEWIHTNDKPYICNFLGCDYRCVAKSALYSHQLKHEKEKNMVYCDKCSYSTVYKQSLKKHMDSHRRNCVRTRF